MKTISQNMIEKVTETRKSVNLGNNTKLVKTDSGYGVQLYATIVVEFTKNSIVLNSGGHHTKTTLRRINEYIPGRVTSKRGNWIFVYGKTETPFIDGMIIDN